MKKALSCLLVFAMVAILFSSCTRPVSPSVDVYEGTQITLSDSGIAVDGSSASSDPGQAVYIANDIVYYEDGHDFTYGEGTAKDAHSAEEAAAHTVVHITQPGMYILSGKLSLGQIAVDLGEDAQKDPDAVVNLVLMGVDITCTVAPAIIFYSVYECGSDDAEDASMDVYTDQAGANIIVADGTENTVSGSYVARIYKPGTVELNKDGTEVKDAKKLLKYD
ncbi:MAG: carbohydrate-binding domain-containing protein, partial [Oscillospiraceae bacterium]|nr:carbohydrate-binding domain-containing protein [Oscillospiraceae bacterium]